MTRTAPRFPISIVAALLVLLVATLAPSPVSADTAEDEQTFVTLINGLRAEQGLQPLVVDPELTAQARIWARSMADADDLAHAPDMSAGISAPWTVLGENVGVHGGHDLGQLFDAFVASPTHYANLTDPRFRFVGVGVVHAADGKLWTTHRFMATSHQTDPDAPTSPSPASDSPSASPTASPSASPASDSPGSDHPGVQPPGSTAPPSGVPSPAPSSTPSAASPSPWPSSAPSSGSPWPSPSTALPSTPPGSPAATPSRQTGGASGAPATTDPNGTDRDDGAGPGGRGSSTGAGTTSAGPLPDSAGDDAGSGGGTDRAATSGPAAVVDSTELVGEIVLDVDLIERVLLDVAAVPF